MIIVLWVNILYICVAFKQDLLTLILFQSSLGCFALKSRRGLSSGADVLLHGVVPRSVIVHDCPQPSCPGALYEGCIGLLRECGKIIPIDPRIRFNGRAIT